MFTHTCSRPSFIMAMTKRNDVGGKIISQGKAQGAKYPKHNSQGSPSHNKQGGSPLRLSPVIGSPPRSPMAEPSPRLSPGLVARHYAGCKFTEPPSASALPLPPKHWTQLNRTVMLPFHATNKSCAIDQHQIFSQHLKQLLKVQA